MDYSIGEFAGLTHLSVHTLRYYEQEHLLTPARDGGNRRRYSENDLAWVDFIRRLKDTGMPIREIARYAQLRAAGDETMKERLAMLLRHRQALQGQIQQMTAHMDKLNEKITYYQNTIAEQMPAGGLALSAP